MGLGSFLGSNRHNALMDDGDECFDLDNLEYASDFGTPTDQSSGEVVAMIQRGSLGRARFGCGSLGGWVCGKPDTLIAVIRV